MLKSKLPFCSIIVLNYNGEKVIAKCIETLMFLDYPQKNYEIIIVDNNSTDKSKNIINKFVKNFKYIKKIYLNANYGFSKGNNVGIKAAKGRYIALLNNDAFVEKNWLKAQLQVFKENEMVFATTSKIYILRSLNNSDKFKKQFIQNAGSLVFQDGYGRDIGSIVDYEHSQLYEVDKQQYDEIREVYSICGAGCMIRKDLLEKLGYLDESFFFYYEDTDLSERARFCGYKLKYVPKAITYHLHSFSSTEWSPFFIYNAEKGRLLHVYYNFPLRVFINQYLLFLVEGLARLFGVKNIWTSWRVFRSLAYLFLIIPAYLKIVSSDKKFVVQFKSNIQYLKVSVYFIFNFTKLYKLRTQRRKFYGEKAITKNYQEIISGKWYFNLQ